MEMFVGTIVKKAQIGIMREGVCSWQPGSRSKALEAECEGRKALPNKGVLNCSLKSQQVHAEEQLDGCESRQQRQVWSCCGDEMFAALRASAGVLTCECGTVIERTSWVVLVAKSSLSGVCWGIREPGSCDSCCLTELAQG